MSFKSDFICTSSSNHLPSGMNFDAEHPENKIVVTTVIMVENMYLDVCFATYIFINAAKIIKI